MNQEQQKQLSIAFITTLFDKLGIDGLEIDVQQIDNILAETSLIVTTLCNNHEDPYEVTGFVITKNKK